MKDLLTGCMSAALLLTAACAQPEPLVVAPGVAVDKLDCAVGNGSQTYVGDVRLTAKHVSDICGPTGYDFPDLDLTIIDPGSGELPSCRRPRDGELVEFYGFPGTKPNGDRIVNSKARPLEADDGSILDADISLSVFKGPNKWVTYRDGVTSSSEKVRPGYSGGAVVSAETGEFLGIISAAMTDGSLAFFVSAEEICEALKEVTT